MLNHEDAKMLFGGFHALLKSNRDYLNQQVWLGKPKADVIRVKNLRRDM